MTTSFTGSMLSFVKLWLKTQHRQQMAHPTEKPGSPQRQTGSLIKSRF